MSDNMDCPKFQDGETCLSCGRTLIDAWDIGEVSEDFIFCNRCSARGRTAFGFFLDESKL